MTRLRTIVVDDESLARRGLLVRLQHNPAVEVIAECANGHEALIAIAAEQPELIFLDIQMPGLSGFDVVARLQGDTMPMVIFVTAFDDYAVRAFQINAVDYVLKPLEDERLAEAVQRAVAAKADRDARLEKDRLLGVIAALRGDPALATADQSGVPSVSYPDKLVIKDAGQMTLLPVFDITWIDAAGDYMCVHTGSETHIMRSTMKQLQAQLDPARFLRVHRSTLVNIEEISSINTLEGQWQVLLKSGEALRVSRGYRDALREMVQE